jgi:GNAT superfamily N-acetyltransferase
LFVDPAIRGKGVGRALIDALHKIAIERGSKRLYWTTAVDNETARKLYDKVATTEQIQYRIII